MDYKHKFYLHHFIAMTLLKYLLTSPLPSLSALSSMVVAPNMSLPTLPMRYFHGNETVWGPGGGKNHAHTSLQTHSSFVYQNGLTTKYSTGLAMFNSFLFVTFCCSLTHLCFHSCRTAQRWGYQGWGSNRVFLSWWVLHLSDRTYSASVQERLAPSWTLEHWPNPSQMEETHWKKTKTTNIKIVA